MPKLIHQLGLKKEKGKKQAVWLGDIGGALPLTKNNQGLGKTETWEGAWSSGEDFVLAD